jgi:WD40 repeat protein
MSARHLFYVVAILAAFIASAQPVEERKANDNAAQQQQQLSTLPSEQPRLVTQMGHSDQITSATFSPEGRFVVTGGWIWDDTARLWDVATGREIRQFRGHSSSVDSVAFSPDGRWVLTGSGDGTARL